MFVEERNYGIDLLRIVSMYMIVILHVLGQGGILWNVEVFSIKYDVVWFVEIFCYCSVTCYALITGYVMCDKKVKYKNIFNLWFGVFFWSVLLTLIMNCFYPILIGKKDMLKSMFPIIFNKYWYFSAYYCLYFFLPFINKSLSCIDKRYFKRLIVTIVVLFSFIGIVNEPFVINSGYSFIWLFAAYIIGYYIKKYDCFKNISSLKLLLIIFIMIFITWLFKIINIKCPYFSNDLFSVDLFIKYNSPTILVASVCLLIIFSKISVKNKYFKRLVKKLAPATFGVYIIHVHTWVWNLLIKDLFKFITNYNASYIFALVLFFSFMVYMLCSYLEMIRLFIFRKLKLNKLVNILYNCVRKIIIKIENI